MLKVGSGYDLHQLVLGNQLWVGGVELPSEFGSLAHSDGDALIHAVIDCLLSPLNLGDVGSLFPDNKPEYKGISSMELLRRVYEIVQNLADIQNIDCTVILDQPKILPHIPAIKKNIAGALHIQESQIGIKGKTTENTKPFIYECYTVSLIDVK